ncbi:hypothetical protein QLG10_06340 [Pseudomonas sp. V98_8]|jgi:hypothetical protein|uniref:hypothetical protein n=1 Tax=Pseudomonas sp. V98_8 TaxID=3044228 RepID=UPI00249DEDBA|nr:hypothetical protein [Pseudomonas sp. V98_8]MDI3392055.1 hypothetical protein [Pseudomonas sp. V98_8]
MIRFQALQPWAGAMAVLLGSLSSVWAQEVQIQASFKPDSANPQRNQFQNDTPPSGYCASYPSECRDNGMFSLRVPIEFDSSGPIVANHGDARQGAMIKVPAQWRELTVIHETTGEPETVKVRIAGFGSAYVTDDVIQLVGAGNDYREAHNKLWGSSWVNAPSPCLYSGVGFFAPQRYRFFWKTPSEVSCQKQAKFDVPWMRYEYVDFAYELVTPNPLGMSSGKYLGNLTYTIGPHGDFDLGDIMLPSSPSLTLNFALDVQHTLKVEVPPGGSRVELVPQGGWQSWLTQGRKPTRLFRDQTFNISASSRFKMQLQCQYVLGNTCSLNEPLSGDFVPLNVGVSLPHGLTDAGGQPVNRRPLRLDGSGTQLFMPGIYVDRKPGTMHFEIPASEVAEMISPGQQRRYSGRVTVIWDSEV